MLTEFPWQARSHPLVVLVDVKGSEHLSELHEQQPSERVDVLFVFDVASLHVLLSIEQSDCLVKEVLFGVALRQSDEEFRNEAAHRELDVDVAVEVGRVLTADESEHLD